MRNLNKKAFTPVITTVVLIVVAILSILLLYKIVINLTTTQLSPEAFNCIEQQSTPPYQVIESCHDLENNELITTIKASLSNNEIPYLEFIVEGTIGRKYGCGTSNKYQCSEDCVAPTPGQTKTFYLDTTGMQDANQISLAIDQCVLSSPVPIEIC
jgi:flagellin-like protein